MDAVHPASLLHGTKGMLSHRTRGSVILRLLPRPPRCPHPYLDHRGAWLNPPSSTPHRLSLSTVTHPPPPTHQEDDFYSMNFISCPAPTLSPLYTQHPVLCLAPHGDSDPFFFFFFWYSDPSMTTDKSLLLSWHSTSCYFKPFPGCLSTSLRDDNVTGKAPKPRAAR